MRFLLSAFAGFIIFFCAQAFAGGPVFDANIFYFSDTFTYSSTTTTVKRTMWDFCLCMNLSKKGQLVLGWNYDSMAFDDNPGTATKLTVSDMGPKIIYYVNKDRTIPIGFTYDLITKGQYTAGTAQAVELRGSAMKVDFGYTPEISEGFLMGFKFNYYKPSFAESVQNTTITKTTNSRAVIYPTFSMTYRFD